MQTTPTLINEATLNTDLNELAYSLIREFSMAARKVSIYGTGHPVSVRSLGKPMMVLARIFKFKQYININLSRGELYVLNISLKDNIFTRQIAQFMQLQDVSSILFEQNMTAQDFNRFVERFVERVNLSERSNLLSVFLTEKGIDSIQVNSEEGISIFENQRRYRGDVDGDFTVRAMAMQQLGDNINTLVEISNKPEATLKRFNVDFHPDIITYILPEKIASMPTKQIREQLFEIESADDSAENESTPLSDTTTRSILLQLIECHPERDTILEGVDHQAIQDHVDHPESYDISRDIAARLKQEPNNQIDQLLDDFFSREETSFSPEQFSDSLVRLLKTGQNERALQKIIFLIDWMGASQPVFRQRALGLLIECIDNCHLENHEQVFTGTITEVITRIADKQETYEYSELAWQLMNKCLDSSRFELMARLVTTAAERRRTEGDISIFDSMAIKQIFANLNRQQVLTRLIDKLIEADFALSKSIREILVGIGSEEVALALTDIISHPVRNVRQQALKILAEMGKPAVKICSQILVNDCMFERDRDRHELPDSQWFVIRNAIFVLGLLKDPDGVIPLRLRLGDYDVRVRREIISALEKIGGEEACDLLVMMTDDPVREIREKAIITAGLIGSPEMAPLIIDAARKNPVVVIHAVTALGKIGGKEALDFLTSLIEDEQLLSDIAGGEVAKDDLRLALVKSIGKIGDTKGIEKIKEYQDGLTATQKIFFKKSPVNKAISDILSRQ